MINNTYHNVHFLILVPCYSATQAIKPSLIKQKYLSFISLGSAQPLSVSMDSLALTKRAPYSLAHVADTWHCDGHQTWLHVVMIKLCSGQGEYVLIPFDVAFSWELYLGLWVRLLILSNPFSTLSLFSWRSIQPISSSSITNSWKSMEV